MENSEIKSFAKNSWVSEGYENEDDDDDDDDDSNDYDDDDLDSNSFGAKRLLEGIDIKDLCDGKEVIIKVADDYNENIPVEDELTEDIVHFDPTALREKRGAPPLNYKFQEIASRMVDVTPDGLVKKQIISSGVGNIVPDQAFVTIHYNMYKESCEVPFDSTYLRNRPEKFRLDQGETIVGLELAIKSMKKHENSRFFIKWEVAYGALGCPDRIEPKCDIIADVTLTNFVEIENKQDVTAFTEEELDNMDFNKSMSRVKQLICNGSDEFSRGNVKSAIIIYKKLLKFLNGMRLANEEQEKLYLEKRVKVLVNLAVCYNKLGRPEQACVACQEALSIDRRSVKANFHYGKANLALSNFKTAEEYLRRADRLKPDDGDINKELKKLNEKRALYKMSNKLFWKKAFDNEAMEEEKESPKGTPLNAFEESLRQSLEESLREKKWYVLPGPLHEDEKAVCSSLANKMDLDFEAKEESFVFSCKRETLY